jgi:hypothetical protein
MRKYFTWMFLTVFFPLCLLASELSTKNHAFKYVMECDRDYAEVNFCDQKHISAIKFAIKKRRPDFNGHYIFLSIPIAGGNNLRSVGVIDTITGVVYPLPFDYFGGYVDSRGYLDKNLEQRVEYGIESDEICFRGSIYAYRNTFENDTSCYVFDGVQFIDQRYKHPN